MGNQRQFPAEIVGILQTRVHAEATDRRVDVRGITGKEHIANRITRYDSVADSVKG